MEILTLFERTCECCGGGPLARFDTPTGLVLWHCSQCELYQKGRVADSHDYNLPYHDRHGYAARRDHKLRTAAVRLNRVAGLLDIAAPKVLDIGCSLGFTVEAAQMLGWEAHGVDVSDDAVENCRGRGLKCRLTDAVRLPYDDAEFDAVTAWHVIEHVANVAETLAEWSRVLRPGGILALETPDASCLKVRLRGPRYVRFWASEHVYAFRRENLIPFLEPAGLELIAAPWLGPLKHLSPGMMLYAVAYQFHKSVLSTTKLGKAFQLFCRRKDVTQQTTSLRRAA